MIASFPRRAGGYLIDAVAPAVVVLVPLALAVRARHLTAAVAVLALGSLAWLLFTLWNSGWRQGRTGASLGKSVMRTRLVGVAGGRPVGFGRAVARQLAHLLDAVPFHLGYLWPLWDERRQTFADKMCDTLVVVDPGAGRLHRSP